MNKTLKIYEDGSELKVAGLAIAAGFGVMTTAGWIAVLAWKDRRRVRKNIEVLNNNSK